jgi:hypothetical protein
MGDPIRSAAGLKVPRRFDWSFPNPSSSYVSLHLRDAYILFRVVGKRIPYYLMSVTTREDLIVMEGYGLDEWHARGVGLTTTRAYVVTLSHYRHVFHIDLLEVKLRNRRFDIVSLRLMVTHQGAGCVTATQRETRRGDMCYSWEWGTG